MRALLFLIRRDLRNTIRSAFKRPLVLAGYLLLAIILIAFIVVVITMPSGQAGAFSPALFRSIMVLVFAFFYFTSLMAGIEKGSSYFRMADVNLTFTSPLRPNQILIYGFIRQLGGTLLLLFVALCQIPNLKNYFALEPYGVAMLLLSVVAYALSYPLISMITYSWTSARKERKRRMKRILEMAALIVALIFLLDLSQTRDFTRSLIHVFDNPAVQYFPLIGWTGSIASAAVTGFTTSFFVGAAGMAVIIAGLSLLLYKVKLDYYEDVLAATEYAEAFLKAKREGRSAAFVQKARKNVRGRLSGRGAKALFAKNMIEIRKTSLFLFLDRVSITVILSALAFKFIMPAESDMNKVPLIAILSFSAYVLLLMQSQGRWSSEMEKPYIFLIPASSYEKLFYATLSDHVKNLFDGAVLFTLSGIFFKARIPAILACVLSYAAFGAVFVYSDVLSRRLFGRIHSRVLQTFVKFIFSMILLVPGIIAAVIAGIAAQSELMAVAALGGWAFVLAVTLFVFAGSIFNNIEAAS